MSKEVETIYNIITLGDSGVGKTSILRRFIYDIYEDNSMSTIGLSFSFKEIVLQNKKKVKIKIIDTGGQEKYRAVAKTYFKNTDGVLFVYAIDKQKSFDDITEWIDLFNRENNDKEGFPKILVEAKNDLERVVDKEISENFAKERGLGWISTSSKKNDKIDDLFQQMAEEIYKEKTKNGNKKQKNIVLKKVEENNKKKGGCCLLQEIFNIEE